MRSVALILTFLTNKCLQLILFSEPTKMNDDQRGDGWPGQFLQQAVLYDNAELLQCLLEGEELANIDASDVCGRTAIYTAVSNNSLNCLRLLLDHGGMQQVVYTVILVNLNF
jgi:ankyrin repeat protein